MKKILTCLLTSLAALQLTGCSKENFEGKEVSFEENTFEVIELDVTDRFISVTPSNDSSIHLSYFESESNKLTYNISNKTLFVSVDVNEGIFGVQPDIEYRSIELNIPKNVQVSMSLNTQNEDIYIDGLSFNNLTIKNSNGDISFKNISTKNDATFANKNADISGNLIGSWDDYSIKTTIKKGESNLPSLKEEGAKKLIVENNNGDIQIDISQETK